MDARLVPVHRIQDDLQRNGNTELKTCSITFTNYRVASFIIHWVDGFVRVIESDVRKSINVGKEEVG